MQIVTKEFNGCLRNSIVPQEWLYGHLRPVEKSKRDTEQISTYKIITQQNVYGKLLEKIIAGKI